MGIGGLLSSPISALVCFFSPRDESKVGCGCGVFLKEYEGVVFLGFNPSLLGGLNM